MAPRCLQNPGRFSPAAILDVYRRIFFRTQASAVVDCAHGAARAFELAELMRKEPDLRLVVVSIVRPADSVASSQLRVALERNRISDNVWPRLKTVSKAVVSRQKILRQIHADKLNCEVVTVDYATLCDRPLDVLRPSWEKARIESTSSAQWLGEELARYTNQSIWCAAIENCEAMRK
jgi:hypothetical protein